MDTILLIIIDWNLRQLYHELFSAKNIEVVPANSVPNAILLLTMTRYSAAILCSDGISHSELETFLGLHQKHKQFLDIPVFLLTSGEQQYVQYLSSNDGTFDLFRSNPEEIVDAVKATLTKKKKK